MQFENSLPIVLAVFLPTLALMFTFVHHARIQRGQRIPPFRPLPGLNEFQTSLGRVAESGRPVHVATGASEPGALGPTAPALASLLLVQRVAENTVRRGGTVIISAGDLPSYAGARGAVRQAYNQTGFATEYRPDAIRLVAHQTPIAYAAGVAARYAEQPLAASLVAGEYGAEALLIGAEGAVRNVPQIGAAATINGAAVLALTSDALLIGEELFAAEAYLAQQPTPRARLLTQDVLRLAVIGILLAGILYELARVVVAPDLPPL